MLYETIGISAGVLLATFIALKIKTHYKKILESIREELKETKNKLRSAFIKFGKSFENFIPFIENFPGDQDKTVFFGMPIDFISFDEDCVRFIECKTGQSQLNQNQRRIKNLIDNGKVKFIELRYGNERD